MPPCGLEPQLERVGGDGRTAARTRKATRAFFFGPRGRAIQNTGVLSDVTVPAMFNTDGYGEVAMPYTLTSSVTPPLSKGTGEAAERSWKPVTAERVARLSARSQARVAASEQFHKVSERIAAAKKRAQSGVVRIAELLNDNPDSTSDVAKLIAKAKAKAPPRTLITKDGNTSIDTLSVYHREALEILADHVALGG